MTRRVGRRRTLAATAAALTAAGAHLLDSTAFARLASGVAAQDVALPPGALALLDAAGLWLTGDSGARRHIAAPPMGGWIQDPAWSPDGSELLYAQIRFATGPVPAGTVPWPTGEIHAYHPTEPASPPRIAARPSHPAEILVCPRRTADGSALLVVSRRAASPNGSGIISELVLVDPETGTRRSVDGTRGAAEVTADQDGGLAVVIGDTAPLTGGTGFIPGTTYETLRFLPSAAGPARPLAASPGSNAIMSPRFSPDGRRIAFTGVDSVGLAPGATSAARSTAGSPGWTGGSFAMRVAQAHGARAWPWVVDLEGAPPRRVPTEGHDDLVGLAWLPNGTDLLILDAAGLAVVGVDDGAVRRVPDTAGGLALAWRPAPGAG